MAYQVRRQREECQKRHGLFGCLLFVAKMGIPGLTSGFLASLSKKNRVTDMSEGVAHAQPPEDVVAEWQYLADRAQQIYGGLVGLSDFGHWDSYFARTFDIYTRVCFALICPSTACIRASWLTLSSPLLVYSSGASNSSTGTTFVLNQVLCLSFSPPCLASPERLSTCARPLFRSGC